MNDERAGGAYRNGQYVVDNVGEISLSAQHSAVYNGLKGGGKRGNQLNQLLIANGKERVFSDLTLISDEIYYLFVLSATTAN